MKTKLFVSRGGENTKTTLHDTLLEARRESEKVGPEAIVMIHQELPTGETVTFKRDLNSEFYLFLISQTKS